MCFHVIVINGIHSHFQLFSTFVPLKNKEDQNTYDMMLTFLI